MATIISWSLAVMLEALIVVKFVTESLAISEIQIWSIRVAVVPFDQVQSVRWG